jgi:hypothetical protein
VESILRKGLDRKPLLEPVSEANTDRRHEYLRGPDYYQ